MPFADADFINRQTLEMFQLWLLETSAQPAFLDVPNRPVGDSHVLGDILERHGPPQFEHHSLEAVSVRFLRSDKSAS